jgi:S-methylmethionine-dependent homocysteine/selenocysteine methylase
MCKVSKNFIQAGAQIIRTNTYQASVGGFMEHLGASEEQSIALIKSAVDLAKEAINRHKSSISDGKIISLCLFSRSHKGIQIRTLFF